MDELTTWRKLLAEEMAASEDTSPVIAIAPSEDVLDVEFDAGYGSSEGPEVLVWTEQRVYYPVVYDGAEWMDSAPRNPQAKGQPHSGSQ